MLVSYLPLLFSSLVFSQQVKLTSRNRTEEAGERGHNGDQQE